MKVVIHEARRPAEVVVPIKIQVRECGTGGIILRDATEGVSGPNILYIDERGVNICNGYSGELPTNADGCVLVSSS